MCRKIGFCCLLRVLLKRLRQSLQELQLVSRFMVAFSVVLLNVVHRLWVSIVSFGSMISTQTCNRFSVFCFSCSCSNFGKLLCCLNFFMACFWVRKLSKIFCQVRPPKYGQNSSCKWYKRWSSGSERTSGRKIGATHGCQAFDSVVKSQYVGTRARTYT